MNRTRAEDEVTLRILELLEAGRTPYQIGRTVGMRPLRAMRRAAAVIDADRQHDPEAETYWKGVSQ